jgi:uncharacterized protein (UPF0333 family)
VLPDVLRNYLWNWKIKKITINQGGQMSGKKLLSLAIVVIISLTFLVSFSTAAEKQKPLRAQTSASQAPATNNITQAAMKAGVNSCAGRINQITNFLLTGSQGAGATLFLPDDYPDKQLFSASIEIPLKGNTAYASVSFAPNQAGGCNGMYETVIYWPQNCAQVAEKQFSSFQKTNALSKTIAVRESGTTAKVFLMPAGTGCVSIKKEIIR